MDSLARNREPRERKPRDVYEDTETVLDCTKQAACLEEKRAREEAGEPPPPDIAKLPLDARETLFTQRLDAAGHKKHVLRSACGEYYGTVHTISGGEAMERLVAACQQEPELMRYLAEELAKRYQDTGKVSHTPVDPRRADGNKAIGHPVARAPA